MSPATPLPVTENVPEPATEAGADTAVTAACAAHTRTDTELLAALVYVRPPTVAVCVAVSECEPGASVTVKVPVVFEASFTPLS